MIIEEHLSTEATNEVLNDLLRAELSTVEAYREALQAALDKTESTELYRAEEDHRVAVEKIREFVLSHGGKPVSTSGSRGSFLRFVQGAANHLGHFAAFTTLKRNEAELLRAYEEACLEETLSLEAKEALVKEFMVKCENHLALINHFRNRGSFLADIFKVPA